jgi:hypothetical protein
MTVCMGCMGRSLSGCVGCESTGRKAARVMVKSGAALMS